jgi:CBS-domain-containing membrane protein
LFVVCDKVLLQAALFAHTLLLLLLLSVVPCFSPCCIKHHHDSPFGALMTLFYGLTAAPASQPCNIILGQSISMTIGICFAYADGLTDWMKQALAASLAIACMVKLRVTHPPAGATAMVFATGRYGWGNLVFMLVGNVVAIAVAALINNWSDTRQYPSYWGLPLIERLVGRIQAAAVKKES